MKPFIWIIDDEWQNYDIENSIFQKAFKEYDIRYSEKLSENELAEFGHNADAVICQVSVTMDAKTIAKLDTCKVISVYGSGYNNIDISAAKEKGIPVAFVPGYCAVDIAEYVLGAILYFNKGFAKLGSAIKAGLWGAQAATPIPKRLSGQKLFVVGLGRIGREVAKKSIAAGLEVLAYDPYVDEEVFLSLGVKKTDMQEGLQSADFISIHSIYNTETESLLGMQEFSSMKNTAVFINASRGGVINQDELVKALNDGVIAGAALDVIKSEPPQKDDPILSCKNLLLTPHISYLSEQSLEELQRRAAASVASVLNKEECTDIVPGT